MTSLPLTASYIAIDLPTRFTDPRQCNALIQMMVYQFGVMPENSPITYLRFKNEKEKFRNTADSIEEMWIRAEPLDIKEYRKKLRKRVTFLQGTAYHP